MKDAAAIIVAGGQGKRFGGRVSKQYVSLCGRPLLWWSLRAFDRSRSVGTVILVVPREDVLKIRRWLLQWKVRIPVQVVAGGLTRADSVRKGLASMPPGYRWVAVHDAVRPLVTPDLIKTVLRAARRFQAAIAASPSKDTVKLMRRDQTVQRTLTRSTIWLAQTPQAFSRSLLERAHRLTKRASGIFTDDAQMVERLGIRVRLVKNPSDNLKVTVPSDLAIAHLLLKGRR